MTTGPDGSAAPGSPPTADELAAQVHAVARTVDVRTVDGELRDEVVLAQTFPVDVDVLWGAVTTAERIGRWFLPVSGELADGGRYAVEGNASGHVLLCRPPHGFEVTWEFADEVSWVSVELAREDEDDTGVTDAGTRLTLTHRLPRAPQWETYGPGAVGVGWDTALLGLSRFLAAHGEGDARLGTEWLASPPGFELVRASGRAWGHAHAASGVDEAAALAAAARTVAAYTGRPEA